MTELSTIYRRELLSFLQYVRQATPYVTRVDRPLAIRLQQMADEERVALEGFAAYLDRARLTLQSVGAFPTVFTNYNFIAVRKLLPILRADQTRGLALLDQDVLGLADGPDRAEVAKLAALKRLHLKGLDELAA